MHRREKVDLLLSEIAANIQKLEQDLKDEYKRLIQTSPDFDDVSCEFVMLERKALSPDENEYQVAKIVDRFCARLCKALGPERDTFLMMQAALAVVDETSNAARTSRD